MRLSSFARCLVVFASFAAGAMLFGLTGIARARGVSSTISTVLSDSASCSETFQHVWITVSDIQAHLGGAGWLDLTPALSGTPVQIDLLNQPANECFLATLGSESGLPAGKYQQLRIILFDPAGNAHGKGHPHGRAHHKGGPGATPPPDNACADALGPDVFNCVQLASGDMVQLSLTSEATSGIKIPAGQIGGGGLRVASGDSADVDIDFNACRSVVAAGNSGKFILKPSLHADEIDISTAINGRVVLGEVSSGSVVPDGPTPTPVVNANVWLESQLPANTFTVGSPTAGSGTVPVENLLHTTTTDAGGNFEFCPMPAGTYEIVADAGKMPVSGGVSNATITTNVIVTASSAPGGLVIPLLDDGSSGALLEGVFSTENSSAPPGAGDAVTFGGVQAFDATSGAVQAIIPPLDGTLPAAAAGALPSISTAPAPGNTNCPDISSVTCPSGTNCGCFTLALPASNPVIGAAGSSYAAPISGGAYAVIGSAANLSNPTTPECSPSNMISDPASPIGVTGGIATVAASDPLLRFAGCD